MIIIYYVSLKNVLFISGESNVYTLGNIGIHRVVCTKLPTVGHTREAMIAAGNTTTRLLGEVSSREKHREKSADFLIICSISAKLRHRS